MLALATDDAAECLGVNSRIQLAQVTKVMQRRINHEHMAAGVTMVDPDQVWIGPDAVSYTHLDVYKRQVLPHAAAFVAVTPDNPRALPAADYAAEAARIAAESPDVNANLPIYAAQALSLIHISASKATPWSPSRRCAKP